MFYGILRVTRLGCEGFSTRHALHRDCPALFHATSHVSVCGSPRGSELYLLLPPKTPISPVDDRLAAESYLVENYLATNPL